MPWLNPNVRCNCCGTQFAECSATQCPGCGADLARVGTRSELRDWGSTRRRGRGWFLWVRCVLGSGGLLALAGCVAIAVGRRSADPIDYVVASVPWLVAWYVIGEMWWRGAEREYAAWIAGSGTAETSAPPEPSSR
jgi:hypothetical protein